MPKLSEQQTWDKSRGYCQVCHLCQIFSLSVLLFLERAAHLPDIHQTVLETLWYTLHAYTLSVFSSMAARVWMQKVATPWNRAVEPNTFPWRICILLLVQTCFLERAWQICEFIETVLSWCCQLKLLSHVVRVIMLFTSLLSVIKVTSYWTGRWKAVDFYHWSRIHIWQSINDPSVLHKMAAYLEKVGKRNLPLIEITSKQFEESQKYYATLEFVMCTCSCFSVDMHDETHFKPKLVMR